MWDYLVNTNENVRRELTFLTDDDHLFIRELIKPRKGLVSFKFPIVSTQILVGGRQLEFEGPQKGKKLLILHS